MKTFLLGKGSYLILYFLIIMGPPPTANAHVGYDSLGFQQQTVTGTVSDATGVLPGVTVLLKGTAVTAITGEDGRFSITATIGETLVFEFLGYKSLEIAVSGARMGTILLIEDTTTLEEVTINAGYYTVKQKESTGSISKVTAAQIEKQPVSNPLAALQGRMSGVNIQQATGVPGGGFSIQVRGVNSIRTEGNDPLYVVDGVPYPSQTMGSTDLSGLSRSGTLSPLGALNPADIQSIEVLKDADATAIYGSRGANGVVLITTKKGQQGKAQFTVNAYTTVGKSNRRMKLMDTAQYLAMRREAFTNDGITAYPEDAFDVNGTWDPERYTDWQKELLGGTAAVNSLQAAVSGGSATTQYLLSGTYRNETTVFPGNSDYGKGTVQTNLSHRSDDGRFGLNMSASYTSDNNTLPGVDLTSQAMLLAPNAPALYDSQGNLNWENGSFDNPLGFLESVYEVKSQNLIANALFSYKLPASLEAKLSLGYTSTTVSEIKANPTTMYSPFNNVGNEYAELYTNNATRESWIAEPQLNWKKQWGDFTLDVLAGATFQKATSDRLSQYGQGFPSNDLIRSLAAATSVTVLGQESSQYNYNAFFGRVNLNYRGKYIVNATGRRDGSSRFGDGKRFGTFGAIGAAWLFAEEPAIASKGIFSHGKLRSSYGVTGNDQIGDYQFMNSYIVSGNNYNGVIGLQPARLYNPDFGWESNRKLEAALEAGFFKDRVNLTLAWFRNRSSSQLVGIPLPGTTGFSSVQANLDATVQNTGLEIGMDTDNLKSSTFSWHTSVNLTIPRNKLLSFPNLEGSTYANTLVIGQPLKIVKVYKYTGIDPETGTYTVADLNGDGQITATGDRQILKDTGPKFFGGLANTLTYKNWELDFLFQFVRQKGRNYRYTSRIAGTFQNQPEGMASHWPSNTDNPESQHYTTGQDALATQAYFNFIDSDATISDASYIRLKTFSLSYTLPPLGDKGVHAKLYLQGQNILTWTRYKGLDPETQSTAYLPPLRQWTLGLQMNF